MISRWLFKLQKRLVQLGKGGFYIALIDGRWFLLLWERPYLLGLFHINRGKDPKLNSSALSNPTIYQTFVTKLLDIEATTPYLKNLLKEDRHEW